MLGLLLAALVRGDRSWPELGYFLRVWPELATALVPSLGRVPGVGEIASMAASADPERPRGVFAALAPDFFRRSRLGLPAGEAAAPGVIRLYGVRRRPARPGPRPLVASAASDLVTLAVSTVPPGVRRQRSEACLRVLDDLAGAGLLAGNVVVLDPKAARLPRVVARIGELGGRGAFPVRTVPPGPSGGPGGIAARGIVAKLVDRPRPAFRRIVVLPAARAPESVVPEPLAGRLGPEWRLVAVDRATGAPDIPAHPGSRMSFLTDLDEPPERLAEMADAILLDTGYESLDDPRRPENAGFAVVPHEPRAPARGRPAMADGGPSFWDVDPGVLEFWSLMRKLAWNFLAPLRRLHPGERLGALHLSLTERPAHLWAVLNLEPEKAGSAAFWGGWYASGEFRGRHPPPLDRVGDMRGAALAKAGVTRPYDGVRFGGVVEEDEDPDHPDDDD